MRWHSQISLLFWGWVWGPMGLILAIPITAVIKAVCDHVESLGNPWGGGGGGVVTLDCVAYFPFVQKS